MKCTNSWHQLPINVRCPGCNASIPPETLPGGEAVAIAMKADKCTHPWHGKDPVKDWIPPRCPSCEPGYFLTNNESNKKPLEVSKPIIVVCALILDRFGRMLMALRHSTQIPPNRWENPGGKVEKGETEREALVREMKEELGVTVQVGKLVSTASFTWDTRLHMLLYHCTIIEGEPQPLESQELKYVDPVYARRQLPCLPATYVWFPDTMDFIRTRSLSEPYTPGMVKLRSAEWEKLDWWDLINLLSKGQKEIPYDQLHPMASSACAAIEAMMRYMVPMTTVEFEENNVWVTTVRARCRVCNNAVDGTERSPPKIIHLASCPLRAFS